MIALVSSRYQAAKEVAIHPHSWRIWLSAVGITAAGLSIVFGSLAVLAFYSDRYHDLAMPVGLVGLVLGNVAFWFARVMRHRRLFLELVGFLLCTWAIVLAFVDSGGVQRTLAAAHRALVMYHPAWVDVVWPDGLSNSIPVEWAEVAPPPDRGETASPPTEPLP